jgi:hypothetical protein
VLYTDGAGVYRVVAKAEAIARIVELAQGTMAKHCVFHIKHVNTYDSRLKQRMRRFRCRHPDICQVTRVSGAAVVGLDSGFLISNCQSASG